MTLVRSWPTRCLLWLRVCAGRLLSVSAVCGAVPASPSPHYVYDDVGWQGIAGELTGLLREDGKVEALSSAIRTLGLTMASHWPPDEGNPNELSDKIHHD